jgi:hypothetical protein
LRTVVKRKGEKQMKVINERDFWAMHRLASNDAIAWRAAAAILLGLATGLLAAWVWSIVEIYKAFF